MDPRNLWLPESLPRQFGLVLVCLIIAVTTGCDRSGDAVGVAAGPDAVSEVSAPTGSGIHWFDGPVDRAFATAAAEDKPVFLYWGAEWCPYCKQVKATVFTRRDFIDRSRLFVPVYLDGDAEEAQRIGEQFRVAGYPTMIVFDSDGVEVTRIPGGLDLEAYATILDLSLTALRPVKAIIAAVMTGEPVPDEDFQRLAYYSWGQDNEGVLAGREVTSTYAALSNNCPDTVAPACMRLYLQYLLTTVSDLDESAVPPAALTNEQRHRAVMQLTTLLNDPSLIKENLDTVLLEGPDLVVAITDAGDPMRAELATQWLSILEALANDLSITTVERLYASWGPVGFLQLEDPDVTIPEAMQATVAAQVSRADRETTDPIERHAVISTAGSVLRAAGLHEQAAKLLQDELERSEQPYYFMSSLASAAERDGRIEDSIAWRKRAYEESNGETTRFRWGYSYVAALIRLNPDGTELIESTTRTLFDDLEDPVNAFYGSTRSRAGRLSTTLEEWSTNDVRIAVIGRIRSHVQKICTEIPGDNEAHMSCAAFLSGA